MKKQMAYLLIIAGLISLSSGIFMLTKKEKQVIRTVQPQRVISDTSNIISSNSEKAENGETLSPEKISDQTIENKKKGDAFEQYVVKRFDRKYFRVKEWRGDKYIDGIYADSNRHPDLEISFNFKGLEDLFAVECKWRRDSFKGELVWAEDYQLVQYQKFANSRNLPVFIIIGIGGSPSDPKYVYIIPLSDVKSHILKTAEIKQFLKTDDRGFYWNASDKSLT